MKARNEGNKKCANNTDCILQWFIFIIVNCTQQSIVTWCEGCLIGGGIAFEMGLDDDEDFKPEDAEDDNDESDLESDEEIQEQLRQLHQENEAWERNKYEGQK